MNNFRFGATAAVQPDDFSALKPFSQYEEQMVTQDVRVQVPHGAQPGQQIGVNVNGSIVTLVVPEGVTAGQVFLAKVQMVIPMAIPMAIPASPGGIMMYPQGNQVGGFQQQPRAPMTMMRQDGAALPGSIQDRLANLYGFEILQVFHLIEVIGFEKANRYNVHEMLHPSTQTQPDVNAIGPHIMLAQEVDTNCCERQFCGPQRSCNIRFHAGTNKECPAVATFAKNFHLQGCCCARASAKLYDSGGVEIADLYDPFYICDWNVRVKDGQGNLIYLVTGPVCQTAVCIPCNDFVFNIQEAGTEKVVGNCIKKFNGCEDLMTDTNRFRVTFPKEIPVAHKLALLGAVFILDFEYFEKKK